MMPTVARTIYRLQERVLKRPTFAVFRELEASQHGPRERRETFQLDRLQSLVAAAHAHTPYWREVMDAEGFGPHDIRSLRDVGRFPLLEKETLRSRREEMVWRDEGPGLKVVRTSGSTNEALQFYTSASREAAINAARMRGHRWIGIEKGDREVYFWGSPVELDTQGRLKHWRDRLCNEPLTNGFEITLDRVRDFVEDWKRWRPKCIFGYPNSFVLTARMAEQLDLDLTVLRDRGLKCIATTSEMLGEVNRRIIEEAFGVPCYDSYGLREAGLVGHECREKVMHTIDEQVLLETIDPATLEPTDGEGELVVTSLISRAMPVIRYRTGDIVTLGEGPCACGLDLGRIEISGGRIADFVVTRAGKWVAGYFIIYICRSTPGVVKFQVRQERIGALRVLLVVDENFPEDGCERVTRAVEQRLGGDDEVEVEVVEDIAPAPSGKYRPVISRVAEERMETGKPGM